MVWRSIVFPSKKEPEASRSLHTLHPYFDTTRRKSSSFISRHFALLIRKSSRTWLSVHAARRRASRSWRSRLSAAPSFGFAFSDFFALPRAGGFPSALRHFTRTTEPAPLPSITNADTPPDFTTSYSKYSVASFVRFQDSASSSLPSWRPVIGAPRTSSSFSPCFSSAAAYCFSSTAATFFPQQARSRQV